MASCNVTVQSLDIHHTNEIEWMKNLNKVNVKKFPHQSLSVKMFSFRAGINKMLVRIANREDPDQTSAAVWSPIRLQKQSDLGLSYCLGLFGRQLILDIFGTFTINDEVKRKIKVKSWSVISCLLFTIWQLSYGPWHKKPCLWGMRTTKAQTSLRICTVWSAPLLFGIGKV